MSTKIQINCVKALEALLKADDECEVEIRKAVLLEYERRHILPTIEARVKAVVGQELEAIFAKSEWNGLTLRPQFKTQVEAAARNAGADAINQTIRDQIRETVDAYISAIDKRVKDYVDAVVLEKVRAQILKKLEK